MTVEDASQRGWEKPGPKGSAQEAAFIRNHLTWVTLNCGVRLQVRKEVAHIFKGFFDELEAQTGYRLADGNADDWGFSNRPNKNNPGVLSNHAYGLAVDGNAVRNPNGRRATNYPKDATRRLCRRWGLRWGEDYDGTPDPMHFEFMGTKADATKYPLGNAAPAAPTSQEDEDMAVMVLATETTSLQVAVGFGDGVPPQKLNGEDAAGLAAAGVKTAKVSRGLFDRVTARAEG